MKQACTTRAASAAATIAVLSLLLFLPSIAIASPSPELPIHLNCGDVYWENYTSYTQGLLSVDYAIGNSGDVDVFNVTITTADATNNVFSSTAIPIWVGDMSPGYWHTATIQWQVPVAVSHYVTTLSICSTCDGTICVDGENGGIDIKPESCPNAVNINSGDIAVAVFSYGSFNASTLIPETVEFAGAFATKWDAEDKNGDGIMDMVFHFDRLDTNLEATDTRACLSGQIIGGSSFRSCDMIKIVGS